MASKAAIINSDTQTIVQVPGVLVDDGGVWKLQATAGGGGGVPATRQINTTAPLAGGGNLSADRTLSIHVADATHDGYMTTTQVAALASTQTTADGAATAATAAQATANAAAVKANNLSDLTNTSTARTNLGLGSVATLTSDTDTTLAADSNSNVATQHAVKAYVDNLVTGVMKFVGSTDCSGNPNYPAAKKGEACVVSVAGKIGGTSGLSVEVGDVYVAIAANAGGTQSAVGTSWDILQYNLVGALLSSNNLSDIANAATARTNLGLGTAATTATTDYATAAQGTLASGAAQKSANLSDLATVSTARTNLGLGTAATTASSDYATAAQGALASTAAQRSGDTFSGLVNCSNQLMLTNTTPLRLGIGFTTGNFSNANAVIESLCNNKRFSFLASTANAALSLVDLQGGGKGAILFADTTGGAYIFDNAGTFDFTSDSQANIRAGTFGNGTSRLRVAGSSGNVGVGVTTPTAVMHLKAGTASANTAPIKLTSGTNLTTPEAGAMEYDGTSLYFTNSSSNRYNLTSPSPWTIDTAWTASNGSAQYFTVGQLAANGLIEVEVNLRAAVSSSALTSDFVMIKARAAFRRPGNTTLACQVLTATQDKQGSGQGVNVFLNIIEQSAGSGTIVVQVNGVASYTFTGQLLGWVR